MAIPDRRNHDDPCRFRNVTLLKDEYLGRGAYGAVYRAKCDQLVCAAKYLHPIFFESQDPGENHAVKSFKAECELLRRLQHPNVVQYLGTHKEEGINTLILLMEEMDCSLNAKLSKYRSTNSHSSAPLVPFHRQVDIMFDVSLAIDYLHTNNIHHRDLSSKNVLLKGDRAKVSDFGVAKLKDPSAGYSSTTPVPGMMVYMPPEVLKLPPKFEKTLDEFSMGVLMIEVMSCKDPSPTDLHIERENGVLNIVPEDQRRKEDIALCDPLNPLLQLALCCISNNPKERPMADHISRLYSLLQTTTEYRNSKESSQSNTMHSSSNSTSSIFNTSDTVSIELVDRSGIMGEMEDMRKRLREKDQTITELQQLLSIRERQLIEKSALASNAEETLQRVRTEVEIQSRVLEEKNRALQDCYNTINTKDQTISQLEGSVRDSSSSIEVFKMQQTQVDHMVGNYVAQIEVLETSVNEMQEEIRRLNEQIVSKERGGISGMDDMIRSGLVQREELRSRGTNELRYNT